MSVTSVFENIRKGKPAFEIGDRRVSLPLIQGGMGVGISLSGLAGSVAGSGGVGVISVAQIGFDQEGFDINPVETNLKAIKAHLNRARQIMEEKQRQPFFAGRQGMLGVNIMTATRFYEKYVHAAVEAGADLIISGAGIPAKLPELVKNSKTKIAPIVSAAKAARVILRLWDKKYGCIPDLMVVEGPLAGGHLGFSETEIARFDAAAYDREIQAIMEVAGEYGEKYGCKIPIAVAGGIDSADSVRHYLELGADAVQVASAFVPTAECDAHENYKKAYVNVEPADIRIVKSPVGMPGRAVNNTFIKQVESGARFPIHCRCCLEKCDPKTIPYCITDALIHAARGEIEQALIFCGANTFKIKEISTVDQVIERLFFEP